MANGNFDSNALGSWSDADYESTAQVNRGVGVDAGVPDEIRFVAGVVRVLRNRDAELQQLGETEDSDIAIFVLAPVPSTSHQESTRIPMLDNGLTKVVGGLWFTAAAVVSAHYIPLPSDTSDQIRFSYVVDDLELGTRPTLIFDPRPSVSQLRWYSNGLEEPDNVELKPVYGDVRPIDVFEAIDRIYEDCLITPSGLPRGVNLWQDARNYRPYEHAEALVQSHLKAGLGERFTYCTIRHEQTDVSGRTDLEIEETNRDDPSTVTRHAILELKVLRSFRSTGTTVNESETQRWIEEGVEQTAVYRHEKAARWSALCCFDMRRRDENNEKCFDHVRSTAEKLDVRLKRWFIFASSLEYRNAQTSSMIHSAEQ